MKALRNPNGITIKQLKELVADLPEINPSTGEDYEVWVDGTSCESGVSNVAKSIWQLNSGDIIIEIDRK